MFKLSNETKDRRTKNDLYNMVGRRHAEKARGEVHTPLHTLRELIESAGVSRSQFFAMCKYHADIAPAPRLVTRHDSHYVQAHFKAFLAEVKTRNATMNLAIKFLKSRGITQLEVSKRIGADPALLSKALSGSIPSCPKSVMDKIQDIVKEIEDQPNPEQKGTVIMTSSIADAFQKALSKTQAHVAQPMPTIPTDWDDETPNATITEVHTMQTQAAQPTQAKPFHFAVTNNVTRTTFDFVRDNPGHLRTHIVNCLADKGYKRSSVHSLLGQMVRQGLLRETDNGLYANQKEYTPIKQAVVKGKRVLVTAKQKVKKAKKAAPPAKRTVGTEPAPVEQKTKRVASTNTLLSDNFDAQKFVDAMTLKQAKAVYDCLRGVFGVVL